MFIWTISDVIHVVIVGILLLVFGVLHLTTWITQRRCRHDKGVGETSACDAICRSCGKNLGFIGSWRAKHNGGTKC